MASERLGVSAVDVTRDGAWAAAEFVEPPAHFWPGYFWVLNDRLEEAELLRQLRDMYRQGARSVCILPEPPEFRPGLMGTAMAPAYLGEDYFRLMRLVVEECSRLGINFLLYDEGGWPSGGAAGQVYASNPAAFAQKAVTPEPVEPADAAPYLVPDDLLCAGVRQADGWRVYRPGEEVPPRGAGEPLVAFRVRENSDEYHPGRQCPYPDILQPGVTARFLALTHERYAAAVGAHFGETIRWAFTDEPAVTFSRPEHKLTWTVDLAEQFYTRTGYDLIRWIPALLDKQQDGEDPDLTRARIDFIDVWSALLVERYLLPLRDWCRAHGLLSGGHFGGDDDLGWLDKAGYGHLLRGLRALDFPGVDTIMRQVFPGVRAHIFPRYAASTAHQGGQRYVSSESFAVYGNGLTPAQMKWVTDHMYARGVNITIGSNYPYSTREHLMPGLRPHHGWTNPLWRDLDLYHAYTARLGYLLTRGEPDCAVAVYFDARSVWAGGGARAKAIAQHDALADALLARQCEFDFVDDDTLAAPATGIDGGALQVGPMRYRQLLIPATNWMEPAALRRLAAYLHAGGQVIVLGALPAADGGRLTLADDDTRRQWLADGRLQIAASVADAAGHISPVVRLDPPCPQLRVRRRRGDDGTAYYLLVNEGEAVSCAVTLPEPGPLAHCDPESGAVQRLATTPTAGGQRLHWHFPRWGSLALAVGIPAQSAPPPPAPLRRHAVTGWTLQPLRRFAVGEHDYRIDELPAAPEEPVALGDWRPALGEAFSGDARYRATFHLAADDARLPARLCLGEVKYACAVTLNGAPIGRRIWDPFTLEITGHLRPGENHLEIVVTNTLANALLDEAVVTRWHAMTGPGWPSSGLSYHATAANYEQESLPSGLYGPVEIAFLSGTVTTNNVRLENNSIR